MAMSIQVKIASSIFCILALFSALPINGQTLRNASLVSMGNAAHGIPEQGLVIQQSIGQSSVTGVFASTSVRISQGFLRGIRVVSKEIKLPFEVIAFPNSFSERVTFRLNTEQEEVIQVLIYDAQGKRVYEANHLPKNKEIQLDLAFLATGMYVTHLRSRNQFVQSRLIKKP
ncbi:MAG: T9SS type A sorting domain-containing protein [Bacteroidetes bacterium]|nr:T9SS type A sorting domain-containing protein [Bacteroidota bacterium]